MSMSSQVQGLPQVEPSRLTAQQKSTIEWLRKGELENSQDEIHRLLSSNWLGNKELIQKDLNRIDNFLADPTIPFNRQDPNLERKLARLQRPKVIYLQTKIIQNVLKDTHYVFFHGQDTEKWMGLFFLINEMERRLNPQKPSHFKYCRSSSSMNNSNRTIGYYTQRGRDVDDHTPDTRRDLISVNSYLELDPHLKIGESAFTRVLYNGNVYGNVILTYKQEIQGRFSLIFECDVRCVVEKIKDFIKEHKLTNQCGNLIVFCIPKETHQSVLYRSKPFGVPFQKGTADPTQVVETKEGLPTQGQYRIFAPALNPLKHCIYLLSRFPKSLRRELKKLINDELNKLDALSKSRAVLITRCAYVCLVLFCLAVIPLVIEKLV